jgi:polar amino acid transport system substrate-binding protein
MIQRSQSTPRIRPALVGVLLTLAAFLAAQAFVSPPANAQESLLTAVQKRGVLRAGIRFDNPPHSYLDEKGAWVGFDVEIAEALAKELGVKLERVKVDQLTRISFLKTGQIDVAIASMSHTIKRDMEIDFSQTYFWSKQAFIVKRGNINSLADLIGKRVGMDRGSHAVGNWGDWLVKKGHKFEPRLIVEFGDKQAALGALRQGAIAGYAQDYEILASFAKKDSTLAVLDEGIGMKQDGIGVRENDSKFLDAINFALQRIETSGQYDVIYNRWFGPDSDAPVPIEQRIEVWPHG